jgi:Icc-related predicted phosphoesterase
MKIVAISDTHSYHRRIVLPEGDILVHAGDITFRGELNVLEDFASWLKESPIKHKIVIFGNHELGFRDGPKRERAIKILQDAGIIYLEDSEVVIDGVKFWGSPWQPWFHDWEFNLQRGKDIANMWSKIPDDTNVLITHGPPALILDEAPRGVLGYDNVGCKDLLDRIGNLNSLKCHIFGHIHNSYGTKQVGPCTFVNAASCTEAYSPTNPPIVVEV